MIGDRKERKEKRREKVRVDQVETRRPKSPPVIVAAAVVVAAANVSTTAPSKDADEEDAGP